MDKDGERELLFSESLHFSPIEQEDTSKTELMVIHMVVETVAADTEAPPLPTVAEAAAGADNQTTWETA